MDPQTRHKRMRKVTSEFRKKIEAVLWHVEKNLYAEKKQNFNPKWRVWLQSGEDNDFMFYNFRIWMMRYHVSLEFILETLLRRWHLRRRTKYGNISFGLPVSHLTGVMARKVVEEAVERAYPTGEHIAIMHQPQPRLFRIGDFDNTYQMIQEYSLAIEKSRRDFEQQMEQRRRTRRNYRKI